MSSRKKRIKPKIVTVSALLSVLVSGCTDECEIHKYSNPHHLKQFLATKQCTECDLEWADFQKANLAGADLRKAELAGANFDGANLRGANLTEASLYWYDGGNFGSCGVFYEDAYRVSFRDADLSGARLVNVGFPEDSLKGANLSYADLSHSSFVGGELSQVKLNSADFTEADLVGAKLKEANLEKANLQEARLTSADLQKANLTEANLQRAKLAEANLSGAELRGANLQQIVYDEKTIWRGAIYNEQTKFPPGFDPKKKGMRFQPLNQK